MSWRGRLTLTFVLLSVALGLGLATFAGAAPLPPSYDLGQYSPFKLPDGSPKIMGPSIVDATYRVMTGGAPAAANDSLFVIFSENVDQTSVATADFAFNGTIAGGSVVRVDRNLVVLSGFTAAFAPLDSVALSARGVINDIDTSTGNEDVSLVAIRTGPAIYHVELRTDAFDMMPASDTLRVYFTH